MKLKLTLLSFLFCMTLRAQQPQVIICMTNCCLSVVDPQAWIDYAGGSYSERCGLAYMSRSGCFGNGAVFGISVAYCPPTNAVVAYVTSQCDPSAKCAGDSCIGIGQPISMPADCNHMDIAIFSRWGCCSITYCILGNIQSCSEGNGNPSMIVPELLEDEFWNQ